MPRKGTKVSATMMETSPVIETSTNSQNGDDECIREDSPVNPVRLNWFTTVNMNVRYMKLIQEFATLPVRKLA